MDALNGARGKGAEVPEEGEMGRANDGGLGTRVQQEAMALELIMLRITRVMEHVAVVGAHKVDEAIARGIGEDREAMVDPG